nr:MAG TPA: hypothetical protein [Caudoviricetes sp.]DAU73623.1 MAG TPA: hypothetical protein [Caudoviricetes sp.]
MVAISIGSMDFRPIFLTETTKVSYFFLRKDYICQPDGKN